ncbi:MAG: type II toxin-antitoxin system HicB family antitoxin [bacterium]
MKKKIQISVEQSPEGGWWAQSPEIFGLFVCGDTRDEALENAREFIAISLDIGEDDIELEIIETKAAGNGHNS